MNISKKDPFKLLNNLDFSSQNVEDIIFYIKTGQLPPFADERQKKKFISRFSKDWTVRDGRLMFTLLNLEVVTPENVQEALEMLYRDPKLSLGKGIDSFYATVQDNFLGITRKDTEKFLKKQETYQITFQKGKKRQKPITASFSNERWGVDLVDMNQYLQHNKGYRYILTGIDYFSRKVFAKALKEKTVANVIEALEDISKNQMENTYPVMLISDNGGEFDINDWCTENDIKLVHTESHSPTQNSLVENLNGSLRRIIRSNFVRINKLVWIDHLQIFVDNKNNSKHDTTKHKPVDIWTKGRKAVKAVKETDNLDQSKDQKIDTVHKMNTKKATEQIEELKKQTLKLGATVRVLNSAMHSEIRKLQKAGNSKLIVAKYSGKIYYVDKISKPKSQLGIEKYGLIDKKGNVLLEEFNLKKPNKVLKPKLFYYTDLLPVDKDTKTKLKSKDIAKLNKIHNYDADVDEPIVVVNEKKPKKKAPTVVVSREKSTRNKKTKDILNL